MKENKIRTPKTKAPLKRSRAKAPARMTAKERQTLTTELLSLLNRQTAETNTIREILIKLKKYTGFEAVAIRLKDGDDFPYYVTNGFPGNFVKAEMHLCARDKHGEIIRDVGGNPCLECMCGNVICGRVDPSLSFFTEGGSFWSNCTTELLASTTEKDRQSRTRDRCNGEGYESVALIPLRSDGNTVGLLQLNDRRREMFTPGLISYYEGIGTSIGIALSRVRAEDAVRKSEKILAEAERLAHLGSWEWDLVDNKLVLSDEFYNIFGCQPEEKTGDVLEPFTHCVDPEDRGRVTDALKRARIAKEDFNIEYTINRTDGVSRFVRTKAEVVVGKRGRPIRVVGLTQDITEQKQAENVLHEAQAELERRVEERTAELAESNKQLRKKQKDLEKKNIALNEVLGHISEEKEILKQQITTNIEESILPTILRLKQLSDAPVLRSLEILEHDLKEISSPFLDNLRNKYRKLTPREIEVCRLIKHGYTSKEIGMSLHISEQTVIKQRKTIRKKLGISNQDVNLANFLESMK
jgi:PAS domain S-box-containing protein